MKEKQENLKREIGLWGLSSNLVNVMIGAGIFVLPAIVAAGLGAASILAYLFCGLLIALVMLCFAEVGSKITSTGGVYAYMEAAYGKYFGFKTTSLFILSAISADAAVANAIADIINLIFPVFEGKLIKTLFFFFLFGGLAYINIIGVKKGIGFVKIITAAKVIPLLLIVLIGFKDVTVSNLIWETTPSINNIGEISLILFFAFQGAEAGLSVSGEVRNPQKTVPRAIFIAILGVLTLYILIQTVAQGVLGDSLPSFEENPLSEVAGHIFGPIGFTLITIGAAVSMFGLLSSDILSGPRVLYGAAKDKVIPWNPLSAIHKKYTTPYITIIIYAGLGFLFASIGGFKQLAIISSATILLIYLGVSLAVIKLRRAEKVKSQAKSFKIPGGYLVPISSALVILWLLSHIAMNELFAIAAFIIILSILYLIINKMSIK